MNKGTISLAGMQTHGHVSPTAAQNYPAPVAPGENAPRAQYPA